MLVTKKHSKILKIAVCLFIATTAIFLLANFSLAATNADLGLQYGAGTGLSNNTDIRVIIARIIRVALGFLGIIAVSLIIYAGWLWMTSAGNPEKIEQAKKILTNAVIGLIIILSAFAIASFVLNQLIGAAGGGGGGYGPGGGPGGGGYGASGGEVVDSTYPANNQQGVTRALPFIYADTNEPVLDTAASFGANTAYVEETIVEPVINRDNRKNQYAVDSATTPLGKIAAKVLYFLIWSKDSLVDNVRGHQALAVAAYQKLENIVYEVDNSGKRLVFKLPTDKKYLGSPDAVFWYRVTLKAGASGILKPDGTSLFGNLAKDYMWRFAVGTEIDNTPPKIVSVIPLPSTSDNPRNQVIQINFNEAIDPTSASGKLEIASGKCDDSPACKSGADLNDGGFKNIQVISSKLGEGNFINYLAGNLYISNQYRTVEFLTIDDCGVNSCGDTIYCLPGEKDIKVLVKAATLVEAGSPAAVYNNGYDGVVDMAGNSLDGNGDGVAQGPASDCDLTGLGKTPICPGVGDNAFWMFKTTNKIDKTPPVVESVTPSAGNLSADTVASPYAVFSKILSSTSLTTESITLKADDPKFHYWIYSDNIPAGKTTVYILHNVFDNNKNYSIQFNASIKDGNQNCFYPCSGLGIKGGPSCCNGVASDRASCQE